jgi:hypothetical protein
MQQPNYSGMKDPEGYLGAHSLPSWLALALVLLMMVHGDDYGSLS